ncbi:hypothetical protein DITRI_Ditri02bG0165100 [Diplodiscus trichospermus]
MAFLVEENALHISMDNDLINSALLMSFLDESSPGEEYNHEELDILMRSLEAEINLNTMDIQDVMMESESHRLESVDDLDFNLGDLEPMPSPSPSNDMDYWHMDTQGEEVNALIEIGDDYSDVYFDDVLEGQMYTTSWIKRDVIETYS